MQSSGRHEPVHGGHDGPGPVGDEGFDAEFVVEEGVQVLVHGLARQPVRRRACV